MRTLTVAQVNAVSALKMNIYFKHAVIRFAFKIYYSSNQINALDKFATLPC